MKDNEDWSFGSKLNTVLLVVLIVLVGGALYIMLQNKEVYFGKFLNKNIVDKAKLIEQPPILTKEGIEGDKDSLVSFSVSPYTKVHGKISYKGVIKGGYFFEGNILIAVNDANKNVVLKSNATATTDWMTSGPVSFEGSVDFTNLKKGPAYIQIHNDNPSGLSANSKYILIPIIIE